MNSNNAVFASVKYETVVYDSVPMFSWDTFQCTSNNELLNLYQSTILANIKDKGKQIHISVLGDEVQLYSPFLMKLLS
jgi:hypothetical protein